MSLIVPINDVVLQELNSFSHDSFIFGDIFIRDGIMEFRQTSADSALEFDVLGHVYATDPSATYIEDKNDAYHFNGDVFDFNTNVTIGGNNSVIDPTKGLQYWG